MRIALFTTLLIVFLWSLSNLTFASSTQAPMTLEKMQEQDIVFEIHNRKLYDIQDATEVNLVDENCKEPYCYLPANIVSVEFNDGSLYYNAEITSIYINGDPSAVFLLKYVLGRSGDGGLNGGGFL